MNPNEKSSKDERTARAGRERPAAPDTALHTQPPDLEAFPGIDSEGATRNQATPTGGTTGGLWSTPGDGTIGNVADAIDAGRDAGDQRSVGDQGSAGGVGHNLGPGVHSGTNSDIASVCAQFSPAASSMRTSEMTARLEM